MKVSAPPPSGTALHPSPVVLVTCIDSKGKPNIITLAWAGTACSDPPVLSLGIRPERYSFRLIEDSHEFAVNVPTVDILKEVDFCGIVSGRDVDKFSETGLTPEPAVKIKPPIIRECPLNFECILKKKVPLGSHHLFLGEIVYVHTDKKVLKEKGAVDFDKMSLFVYNSGGYWSLDQRIGAYGFSKT
ncbi:MAG: flavin reductase family protein [Candidatus Bathyarchaeota archaeon]|jgi:flavin reductase (DIM6/NTAB) family NADH-FMN oxidoreductase RutF